MIIGGGNAAGYAARTFVENGMADGRLCIVTKEVNQDRSLKCFLLQYRIALGFTLCLIVLLCVIVVIFRLTRLMRDLP